MPHSPSDEPEVLLETSRFSVVRHRRALARGGMLVRETVQHPGAVVIVPVLDGDRVCLVRNYRIAVDALLIELPAGTLEPGEAPAETAARELAEETGYTAERLVPLARFFMSPGILNERMHVFVASGLSPGTVALEAGEEIETLLVSWNEAIAMVEDGRIEDAKTVAALLLYDRVRQRRT